ncbi:Bud site selection protein, Revert to axial protein 1, partial [Haplosporangium gracile]
MELELAAYQAQAVALDLGAHGPEDEKGSAHKKQPSVTADMYEPHWSAANRYLEMSSLDGSPIVDPPGGATNSTNPSSPTTLHQQYDLTQHYLHDAKETSDQILMVHNALKNPTAPPLQQQLQQQQQEHFPIAVQKVQHVRLPGAVPASWAHPSELKTQSGTASGVSEGTSTGAHLPIPAAKRTPSGARAKSKAGVTGAGVSSSLSKDAGIAMNAEQRLGINGSSTTKTTTTTENTGTGTGTVARAATAAPRRAMTSGSSGVTKEDLQRSAERIYYKYLIPQAEKRVRIPGEVRQRVAKLMDSKMMDQGGGQSSLAVGSIEIEGSGEVGPSSPVLKCKQNLGSPTTTTTPQLSLGPDPTNEKSNSSKGSFVSGSVPHRFPSSTSSSKEKQQRNRLSSTSHQQRGPTNASILQQPDQDLGLVFAEAREVVFEGMESYYFPRFLKARAYGNMVPSHRLARAMAGLFFLFVGFSVVLSLIFLNIRPRSLRAW